MIPTAQSGFTLVEVLIALTVFSIGLLGLAHLQTQAFRALQDSHQRTQAMVLANDMAERIRANGAAANRGEYELKLHGTNNEANTCYNTSCTTSALARFDKTGWRTLLATHLPEGEGVITFARSVYRITVYWRSRQANRATSLCRLAKQGGSSHCVTVEVAL